MTMRTAATLVVVVTAISVSMSDDAAGQRSPENPSPKSEPLVPGFELAQFDPVPGFGASDWTEVISDRDRREAKQVMLRFDLNQDGQLDTAEVEQGPWSSNFYEVDMNGDKLVSLSELALRYARRRTDREAESASSSRKESSREGTGLVGSAQSSRDERRSEAANGRKLADEGNPSRSGQSKPSESFSPKSYRIKSSYERDSFLSGLPQWFKTRDTDLDGQIMMHEYASAWTDDLVFEFRSIDLNGDGVIVRRESLLAAEKKIEPSSRPRHSVQAAAKATVSRRSTSPDVLPSPSHTQERSTVTPLPTSIPASYEAYARGVLQRYDTDRNEVLTSNEFEAMPQSPAAADTDDDDKITAQELAWWYVRHR